MTAAGRAGRARSPNGLPAGRPISRHSRRGLLIDDICQSFLPEAASFRYSHPVFEFFQHRTDPDEPSVHLIGLRRIVSKTTARQFFYDKVWARTLRGSHCE